MTVRCGRVHGAAEDNCLIMTRARSFSTSPSLGSADTDVKRLLRRGDVVKAFNLTKDVGALSVRYGSFFVVAESLLK